MAQQSAVQTEPCDLPASVIASALQLRNDLAMRVNRRDFLKGVAATAAPALLGCDRIAPDRFRGRIFDLCIVGSGFAGIPLALEGVRNGLQTLLVEAGPHLEGGRSSGTTFRFRTRNSGEIAYRAEATRVIAVGGGSNHWSGTVNRLQPSDLETRCQFGLGVDWPLVYEDLDSYYCRAESFLEVRGGDFVPAGGSPRRCPYAVVDTREWNPPAVDFDTSPLHFFRPGHSSRGNGPVRLIQAEVPEFEASDHGTLLSDHRATRLLTTMERESTNSKWHLVPAPRGAFVRDDLSLPRASSRHRGCFSCRDPADFFTVWVTNGA